MSRSHVHLARSIALLLAPLAVGAAGALAQPIDDVSYLDGQGRRVLALRTTVDAPADEVWRLWTTSEGLRSWLAPVIAVDLRVGGDWEASYDPAGRLGAEGNIHNEILAVVPERIFALRVSAVPPDYPFPLETVREAHSVYLFESISDGATRVTVYGVGYGEGPLWDTIYDVGVQSTRFTLEAFRSRIAGGPVDWGEP